ncbi:MAG: hypothetical protein IKF78_07440 [Atopobiaceae bacterium]|nr:hypothetical protein [Atopobiaceae bacterium]
MSERNITRRSLLGMSTALAGILAGCAAGDKTSSSAAAPEGSLSSSASAQRQAISDSTNGGHAIAVSGEKKSYVAVDVTKTGDDDGDEADFYGTNAAVYAEQGATLDLDDITVSCNGTHANAVFSYGEGTTVNIKNSRIETQSNTSGGIMVTGGGALYATDLTVHTTGNSSAPIRSDRGGGTQEVTGGEFTSDGKGSPVIYSTADVRVTGAKLTSNSSQGVVVEGKNSVALKDCTLAASNTSKNSDKSDWYQAVMIYQSMSGDAATGQANFSAEGGTIANQNGDVFFVNNTVCQIALRGVGIKNEDAAGNFLRAAAAGWGKEGSNGGQVSLSAVDQQITGNVLVDDVSKLNFHLTEGSAFVGAINPEGAAGQVHVEVADGCTWELTADSHITSLSCKATGVSLKGHTLTVGNAAYTEGTESTGSDVEFTVQESSGGPGEGGEPPSKPGEGGGEPPAKPGEGGGQSGMPGGGEPPAKPGEGGNSAQSSSSASS